MIHCLGRVRGGIQGWRFKMEGSLAVGGVRSHKDARISLHSQVACTVGSRSGSRSGSGLHSRDVKLTKGIKTLEEDQHRKYCTDDPTHGSSLVFEEFRTLRAHPVQAEHRGGSDASRLWSSYTGWKKVRKTRVIRRISESTTVWLNTVRGPL